jgi:hypothetical protein
MKNSHIAETENLFTMKGLLTAIINDLDDLHQKVELLEKNLLTQKNGNFIIKEKNQRGNSIND